MIIQNKQLIELFRKRPIDETQHGVIDILKEISTIINRNKVKILQKAGSEKEKEKVMADFKLISEKIDNALKNRK